jgi:hypothetical protein
MKVALHLWLVMGSSDAWVNDNEGTCYGYSGGPILRDFQGTKVVVGVT